MQHDKLKKYSLLFASMVSLSACQSESATPSTVKFSPPERIVQVRAIDLSLVRPLVKLGDGTLITMRQGADNSWSGSIRVEPNQSYQVSVDWIETLPEDDLILAQWVSNIAVDEDGEEVRLSAEDYDYSADYDGDTIPNLEERENGTNPFDPTNSSEGTDTTGTTTGTGEGTSGTTTGDTTAGTSGTTTGDTTTGTGTGTTTGDATTGEGATTGDSTDGTTGTTTGSTTGDSTTGDSTAGDTGGETDGGTGGDTTSGDVHTKASVLIPRIAASAAPAINGEDVIFDSAGNLAGEWTGAVEVDDSGSTLWINNLMLDEGADGEDGAELRRWAALHDGEKLYIVVLSDDIGRRQSDSTLPWDDDSLEVFIDGDNSKFTEYGDADDFHFIMPLQPLNSMESRESNNEISGRSELGPMSSSEELDYEFSTGIGIGPDGIRQPIYELDVYEVAIPLDDANITLGFPAGLELQLNDDDDGDLRDSKWGWFHLPFTETDIPDESYTNPSIMGTVVLEE